MLGLFPGEGELGNPERRADLALPRAIGQRRVIRARGRVERAEGLRITPLAEEGTGALVLEDWIGKVRLLREDNSQPPTSNSQHEQERGTAWEVRHFLGSRELGGPRISPAAARS